MWKPIFKRDDNVTEESGRYGDLKDWGFWISKNLIRIWCQSERPDAQKFT